MAKNALSATSVRAISFAENRTFRAFVLLYALMSLAILGLIGTLYYRAAKTQMLAEQRLAMQLEGERYLPRMVRWMQGELQGFPIDPAYETAFYLGGRMVDGTLWAAPSVLTPGIYKEGRFVYLVIPMGSYGLKDGKTVMMTEDDGLWFRTFRWNMLTYGSALFIVLLLIGVGLSRLFLRPMKAAVMLLDDFIKDTTHELNTPVTAILTNIERLDETALDAKQRKKFARIKTAAQTIGTLYDDLTFLLLRDADEQVPEQFDLAAFMRERLEYFETRFALKQLRLHFETDGTFPVLMSSVHAARLVDNLLSNAVKYSDVGKEVTVKLESASNALVIQNSGPTIAEARLEDIFKRYVRAEHSKGGFGIGLHLVARIAEQYDIQIEVTSQARLTTFRLTWPRYTPRPL